jgi:hypothetical protein
MSLQKGTLPQPALAWLADQGRLDLANYLKSVDTLLAAIAGGALPQLANAPSDVQAKLQGVQVGSLYRNGSQLMVRVS